MPRPVSENDTQFAFRIPAAWLPRADDLRMFVGRAGVAFTRTDVVRIALSIGLSVLEAERDKDKASRASKRSRSKAR